MSGVETVGGSCPHCQNVMLQKWESGGMGFLFDTCFHCGYYYDGEEKFHPEAAINVLAVNLVMHQVDSIKALQDIYKDVKPNPEEDDFYPSIFDYSKDSKEEIQSRVLDIESVDWKKEIEEFKIKKVENEAVAENVTPIKSNNNSASKDYNNLDNDNIPF